MNIIAKLQYPDGTFSVNENDIIAAFVGDECRGVISPIPSLDGLIYLTVGSNELHGETITFKAYLADQGIITDLNESLEFQNQLLIGTPDDPLIYTYVFFPDNLVLRNIFITSGITQCYSASETITVAGESTEFVVYDEGSVTLIAGEKISLLPGTRIKNGGHLQAYISQIPNPCHAQNADMEITYEFSTNKDTYYVGETIFLSMIITNHSTEDIILSFPSGCQFNYYIHNYYPPGGYYDCVLMMTYLQLTGNSTTLLTESHSPDEMPLSPGEYLITGSLDGYYSDHKLITVIPDSKSDQYNRTQDFSTTWDSTSQKNDFFIIYPNPANDKLTILLKDQINNHKISLEIFSIFGSAVLNKQLTVDKLHSINIGSIVPGLYVLRITDGERTGLQKLIKY